MWELEECLDLSNNFKIMFDYGLIDWGYKNEIIIQSPTKDISQVIESIISSNEKQNGIHIYQMYKHKERIIDLTTFMHLSHLDIGGLQVYNHLGYHVNMNNRVFCCFFTSKPKVNYYGVKDVIENIKLEGEISYCNKMMVYDPYDFVRMFSILNDPSMLPINLKQISINNLHDTAWNGFKEAIKKDWYEFKSDKFELYNDNFFKSNIEYKTLSLNYENHHKLSIQRFENKDGLSNHSSLSFKKSKSINKKIFF